MESEDSGKWRVVKALKVDGLQEEKPQERQIEKASVYCFWRDSLDVPLTMLSTGSLRDLQLPGYKQSFKSDLTRFHVEPFDIEIECISGVWYPLTPITDIIREYWKQREKSKETKK